MCTTETPPPVLLSGKLLEIKKKEIVINYNSFFIFILKLNLLIQCFNCLKVSCPEYLNEEICVSDCLSLFSLSPRTHII